MSEEEQLIYTTNKDTSKIESDDLLSEEDFLNNFNDIKHEEENDNDEINEAVEIDLSKYDDECKEYGYSEIKKCDIESKQHSVNFVLKRIAREIDYVKYFKTLGIDTAQ